MGVMCIGPTPAAQRVMVFRSLALNAVNRAVATFEGAAGKAVNVAKVLAVLGAHPILTGFLGGQRGDRLRALLTGQGIDLEFVPVAAPTRECVTVIDESAGTQTELVDESRPVNPADYERLLAILRRRIGDCRAAVMSGTLTPGGPAEFYRQCTQIAHAAGAIAVVDAQGVPLAEALPAEPDLVKPNRAELAATVGRDLPDAAAVMSAMEELCRRGARRVIVTAGKEPTLAVERGELWRIRSPRVAVVNPIGSGDAFTAGLVARLLQGADLGEACRWGCAAGAANALTGLAGEVHREDVERLAREVVVERL